MEKTKNTVTKKTFAGQKKAKDLLDAADEHVGKIESPFQLRSLVMKDMRWQAKMNVTTLLPRSYHQYKITLQLDEKPYLDRIDEFEKELGESLFRDDRTSKKDVSRRVAEQRLKLDQTRKDCEKIEFSAIVDSIKYKDNATAIELRIPDDVIDALNRQKIRLNIYKISLVPLF